jgi:hypothetical protein
MNMAATIARAVLSASAARLRLVVLLDTWSLLNSRGGAATGAEGTWDEVRISLIVISFPAVKG